MGDIPAAEGYAIVEDGKIDVRTVSPTRRTAIINFLVVSRHCIIRNDHSDEYIERVWVACAHGAYVIGVDIKPTENLPI
jgi:hypothetical protein